MTSIFQKYIWYAYGKGELMKKGKVRVIALQLFVCIYTDICYAALLSIDLRVIGSALNANNPWGTGKTEGLCASSLWLEGFEVLQWRRAIMRAGHPFFPPSKRNLMQLRQVSHNCVFHVIIVGGVFSDAEMSADICRGDIGQSHNWI